MSVTFEQNLLATDDMQSGKKPDINGYRELIERFNLKPQATLYVDDHIAEVDMANQLGFITIWVQYLSEDAGKNIGPHLVISSILDLDGILKFE